MIPSGRPILQLRTTSLNLLFFYCDGKVRTLRGKEKTMHALFAQSMSRCFVSMNVYQLAQFSTLLHCVFFLIWCSRVVLPTKHLLHTACEAHGNVSRSKSAKAVMHVNTQCIFAILRFSSCHVYRPPRKKKDIGHWLHTLLGQPSYSFFFFFLFTSSFLSCVLTAIQEASCIV